MGKLYLAKDIAERIGVPKQQVYRYIKERGYLPVEKTMIRGHEAYLYDEKTVQNIEKYFRTKYKNRLTSASRYDTINALYDALHKADDVLEKNRTASESDSNQDVLLRKIVLLEMQISQKDKIINALLDLIDNLMEQDKELKELQKAAEE